jgi:hypothetical protein
VLYESDDIMTYQLMENIMTPNLEYTSKLLQTFENAKTPFITFSDFKVPLDDEFHFHYLNLIENSLITDINLSNINMGICSTDCGVSFTEGIDIRISQRGHDFVNALTNKNILNQLKNDFKGAPFKSLFDISQKLAEHYLKNKLDDILKA